MVPKIGVLKEVKNREYRVGLTPKGAKRLIALGAEVFVEKDCGNDVGFTDSDYLKSGAVVLDTPTQVADKSELIIKIKEPLAQEFELFKPHHTLFTYLHLAPNTSLTEALLSSGATCIAYETVTDDMGRLPLLTPMSEIAGKLASQVGATYCQKNMQGQGILLGGVTGVAPASVVVFGCGVVGQNAAKIAAGLGASVEMIDKSDKALASAKQALLAYQSVGHISYHQSDKIDVLALVENADLVIGAVLIPGAAAPKVLSAADIKRMKKGSVIVDVAIDQGGCFETSRPTSHDDPIYLHDGIIHYCVTNMPSAAAKTATEAITKVTLPFIETMVQVGIKESLKADANLLNGLNTYMGKLTNQSVAQAQGRSYCSPKELLK